MNVVDTYVNIQRTAGLATRPLPSIDKRDMSEHRLGGQCLGGERLY